MKNVIALLYEVEVGEIKLTTTTRISNPSVEVASVGKIIIDNSREHTCDKRVTVAMAFEVVLHILRCPRDATGAEQRFGIRRT